MRGLLAASSLGVLLLGLLLVLYEGCASLRGPERGSTRRSGDDSPETSPGRAPREQGNDLVERKLAAARALEIKELKDEVSALTLALETSRSTAAGDSFEARTARANALFDAGSWMQAGDEYVESLKDYPDRPEAEAVLERALEAYEWEDSEKQIGVLEDLLEQFPARRTARNVFTLAVLQGVHGDAEAALDLAGDALQDLPPDAFRLYALRRMAGLCRKAGAALKEELFLREAHSLAMVLKDERAASEIQRSLTFLAERGGAGQ